MRFFATLVLLSTLLLAGCDNEPGEKQAKFYAFGTEIAVSLYGVDTDTANGTITALENSFSHVDNTWHAWRPSVLNQINQAIRQGESIAISTEVADLITLAQNLAEQSDHLFNPAAGNLFALWGFHQDDWFNSRPPPSQAEIDHYLQSPPSMADITIQNGILSSQNNAVKLGFGGFAKGFAVDNAIASLQNLGIQNALVNIGGDLRAIGMHGKRPWVIGIRHPRQDGMLASLALQTGESVFTSGDYERFFEYQGTRYPHILDPRTGWPANQAISVTVLHHDAATADAAATALFVAGEDWPRVAVAMGVSHVMLVKPSGEIELSPDMHQRILLLDNDLPVVTRTLE